MESAIYHDNDFNLLCFMDMFLLDGDSEVHIFKSESYRRLIDETSMESEKWKVVTERV